ncbi:MmgE/PrpD family protein [Amycolatopsis thermoflava]|uniref:2-methylcitrate dehydratase PrpD n=1 Tax=Amycolatopsis thermoflava TaxID=84480 RepID=A0A3N2H6G6_9PSEU|nr:MmgE/PrpD family protein [Amycolatopsis thermoflava]ROS44511.1 2-methylcitrate dehydratase PrpD [Amycolatopsis thermoflava]
MFLGALAEQLEDAAPRLRPEAIEQAGTCLLDALACAYGGREMPWVSQARSVAGSGDEAAIWAAGGRRSGLSDAVFANSVACHALLHEDTHAESRVHPGTVVIPAALAIGERLGSPLVDVLRAIVLGYEAIAQVAAAVLTDDFVARGWRASSVFGPFGAAAAVSSLLRLDPAATAHALGLAASSSAGICQWARDGTTEVFFQNAGACRAGLVAALLAREGATGAASAVEGIFGLRQAFGGARGGAGLPEVRLDRMAISATFFKAHPSCALTQEAIDAAQQLAAQGIEPDAVADASVHTSGAAARYPGCDNGTSLTTTISRQMSLQFAVAAALTDGALRPHRYSGPLDPRLAELAARTSVVVDPDADRAFPARRDARVTVRLTDGRTVSATNRDGVNPTAAAVAEKFRDYAAPVLGPDADDIVTTVRDPGSCSDTAELVARLR